MDPNGTVSASPWSAQEGADDSSPFDQNDPADLNAACAIDHQANNQNARGVDMGDIETWLANEQQGAEAAAGPDGVDSPDEEETGEELDPDLEEMAEVEDLFDGPDDELFDDEDYEDEWYHQYYDEDQYPINLEEEAFWEEFDDDPFYHEAFDDMHVEEGDEEEWDGGSSSESNIRNRINDLSRSTLECGRTDHDINFLSGPLRSDPDDSSMMRVHALAVSSPHCTASAEGHQQVVFSGDGEIMVYCLEPHQEWTIVASLKTYERHKSLACSPDGTYIAASGSGGYVIVLRLQRAATSGTATCGSRTSADNTATASSAGNSTQDQLVHVAAFACGADQIDCVRFGLFGGRPVLFVAAHCGSIYFLNIPGRVSSHTINKSTSTKQQQLLQGAQQQQSLSAKSPKAAATGTSAAAHFCVNGLPGAKLLPGRCRLGQDLLVQVSRIGPDADCATRASPEEGQRIATCGITFSNEGPPNASLRYPRFVNTAESSADGNWLAVGREDDTTVLLLPASERYWTKAGKQLEVGQHIVDGVSADGYRWLGCQGCAFNASSTLLAASFPRLLVVCVWEVASGHRIRVFNSLSGGGSSPEYPTHNAFPYYPMHVTFAPWDDQLLAIGLRMSDVLLVDIRDNQRLAMSVAVDSDMALQQHTNSTAGNALDESGNTLAASNQLPGMDAAAAASTSQTAAAAAAEPLLSGHPPSCVKQILHFPGHPVNITGLAMTSTGSLFIAMEVSGATFDYDVIQHACTE
eukprot:jgi/Chrzof1/11327/Cz05g32180.t1